MPEIEHIILVNDVASVNGGSAKVAIDSALGLAATGRRVTFFAVCGPADPALAAAGVEIVCLGQRDILSDPDRLGAMRRGLWNRAAARGLGQVLAAADPARSVVHCHGFTKALSPAIGPVLTVGPVPHVLTMHEYFLACPNGGFFDYRREEICARRALGPACLLRDCDARRGAHKLWRLARQGLMQGPGRLPGALREVIFLSETQRRTMLPYLPAGARLHPVANPVAVAPEAERVKAEANDAFLFVGRLSPEKGAVAFARAAQTAGVRAVFVGDGPEAAAVRAANPQAELTGWAAPEAVAAHMRRARCLVFPSLWSETFGLVVAEALSRGLPVIAGRWTAAAELIEPGVTGLVIDRPEGLAAALEAMTPELASALSRAAFARRGGYGLSVEAHVARLLEVYAQAAAR